MDSSPTSDLLSFNRISPRSDSSPRVLSARFINKCIHLWLLVLLSNAVQWRLYSARFLIAHLIIFVYWIIYNFLIAFLIALMKKAGKEKSFRITMVSELIKLFVAVRLLLIFPCELSSQSCPPPFALDGKKYWLCIYLMNPSLSPLCIFIICFCSKWWWAYGHWLVRGTSKSCESRLSRITNSLEVENGKWRNQVQVKER